MIPAYQFRVGKGADRLIFREMLSRLAIPLKVADCKYIGLGGPFLEDFRLIHEAFPTMKLSSIESKEHVVRRQRFHRPASRVKLHHCSVDDYFATIHEDSEQVVVWLDYTNLNNTRLREVWNLVQKLSCGSILRVTLRAAGTQDEGHVEREQWANEIFGDYLPEYDLDDVGYVRFPAMLLRGLKRVVDSAAAARKDRIFQLLNAVSYDDGTQMLTISGVIGNPKLCRDVRSRLHGWAFKNFSWVKPFRLTLPALSLKERLALEPLLPSSRGTGRALHNKLGYPIEGNEKSSLEALDHYRKLADAYPRFVRLAF